MNKHKSRFVGYMFVPGFSSYKFRSSAINIYHIYDGTYQWKNDRGEGNGGFKTYRDCLCNAQLAMLASFERFYSQEAKDIGSEDVT